MSCAGVSLRSPDWWRNFSPPPSHSDDLSSPSATSPFSSLPLLPPLPPLPPHLSPRLGTISSHLPPCFWGWSSAGPCSCLLWCHIRAELWCCACPQPPGHGSGVALNALPWILAIHPLVLFHQRSSSKPRSVSRNELQPIAFSLFPILGLFLLHSNLSNTWCWLQILFSTMSANARAPNEVQSDPEGHLRAAVLG